MAIQADTNRASLFISPEAVWGEIPGVSALAPKMYETRMTGETLQHSKQTVTSNTIRDDRMRDTVSEVGASAEGEINFELAAKDWDLMMEGALAADTSWIYSKVFSGVASAVAATNKFSTSSGDFAKFVVGGDLWVAGFPTNSRNNGRFTITAKGATDITVAGNPLTDETPVGEVTFYTNRVMPGDLVIATTTTITSATQNFTQLGLEINQNVRLGNFTNALNNIVAKLTGISAGTLTFAGAAFVTQSADADAYITGKRIKNGTKSKSYLVEKHFTDIDKLMYFTGMRIGSMELSVESLQLVTGKFNMMGRGGFPVATTVSGTRVDASTTDSMNATTNVGSITEGGSALSNALKSITLQVGNNLRNKPKIGSKHPTDIGYGFVDVTGTVNAYFEDLSLLNKMVNHTVSSLEFRFTDDVGNVIHFNLPRLYFSTGNPTSPGGNQDVMIPLEYVAARDSTTNSVIIVDLLAA